MVDEAAIEPFGDAAILIRLGDRASPELAERAQAIAAQLARARAAAAGFGQAVPAGASVLVPFDPLVLGLDEAIGLAKAAIAGAEVRRDERAEAPPIEIPVRYGGGDGPDLADVAERHGLSPADVVELHAGARYRVLFLGFAPGFAYLGGLPAEIATPRRTSPHERVPAGSVAIAGDQTAVYPRSMPGGWQLIGRTDVVLFDPDRPAPARFAPGDLVRFVPIRP